MTRERVDVMSAPVAAGLAGVSYRQLDYWSRQGWVEASQIDQVSDGRRVRRYRPSDVVRLAALRHLARSGHDVATYGPLVGALEIPAGSMLVVGDDPDHVEGLDVADVTAAVTGEGRWTVFDPVPVLARCQQDRDADEPAALAVVRRSA